MEWPTPRNAKDIEVFQGFANFYRRFVSNFSSIMRPLTLLTPKYQPFVWEKQQARAFQAIKAAISKELVLIHPDKSKPYFLETDTSGAAMSAVLSQKGGDGCLHLVAFISKTFEPTKMNHDTHDMELLTLIRAFEHWRMFWKELSSLSLYSLITRTWNTGRLLGRSIGVMLAGH
ncbi:hypothetical protein OPQ81_003763 [Rhizoctonia solani]|nr:hypothetical protein OPQ81_003763 [Rhizoctonia solani]